MTNAYLPLTDFTMNITVYAIFLLVIAVDLCIIAKILYNRWLMWQQPDEWIVVG